MSWFVSSTPPDRRAFATPRSSRRTSRGRMLPPPTSANVSAVPEQEQRDEDEPDVDGVADDRHREQGEDGGPREVDDDDDPDPVDPVGDDARREAEQQHRHVLGQQRHRDEERVARLGGDQQRPGRERDAVPDVGQDGRREQPPERASEARRGDRLGQASGGIGHRGSLAWPPRGHRTPGCQRRRDGPSWSVTMPPVRPRQRTSTRPGLGHDLGDPLRRRVRLDGLRRGSRTRRPGRRAGRSRGTIRSNHQRMNRASRERGRAISRHRTRPPGRTDRAISSNPRR